MGERSRLLVDQAAFAADTQSLNIPADNVKYLKLGVCGRDTGADTLTFADLVNMFDELLVNLGGHQICKMRVDDLIAYNMIALDHYPKWVQGGATSLLSYLAGIKLPLFVTKGGRSLTTQITWGANTHMDLPTLSVEYIYKDTSFPLHFAYQYESKAVSGEDRWNGLSRVGAALQGILIYQELEDMATASTLPEVAKIGVVIDDREVVTKNFCTLQSHHGVFTQRNITDGYGPDFGSDDGFNGKFGCHYLYLDFSQEPWRADKLQVITNTACNAYTAADGGTVRLIGVYSEL